MEVKSQLKRKNRIPVKETIIKNNFLAFYVDVSVRGLIAFLTLGLFSYYVLYQMFNLPIYVNLPVIFLLSIFSSPLLSKIKVGYIVQNKYDNFLREVILWTRR
jgi:hypothetical protein